MFTSLGHKNRKQTKEFKVLALQKMEMCVLYKYGLIQSNYVLKRKFLKGG
jgi:hypothetical protein